MMQSILLQLIVAFAVVVPAVTMQNPGLQPSNHDGLSHKECAEGDDCDLNNVHTHKADLRSGTLAEQMTKSEYVSSLQTDSQDWMMRLLSKRDVNDTVNDSCPGCLEDPRCANLTPVVEQEEDELKKLQEENKKLKEQLDCADGTCTIADDPHIKVFDGAQISLIQAHGKFDAGAIQMLRNFIADGESGDVWLVKSSKVNIQARYVRDDNATEENLFVGSVAVGGEFMEGNTLMVGALDRPVTYNGNVILEDQESTFHMGRTSADDVDGLITAKRSQYSSLVQNPGLSNPGIDVKLADGMKLIFNRQDHYINVLITMKKAKGGQDGLCGNFNGDSDDDRLEMLEARSPLVLEGDSMFALAKGDRVDVVEEFQSDSSYDSVQVRVGEIGRVLRMHKDGGALVDFPEHGPWPSNHQWVFESNFGKLRKAKLDKPKDTAKEKPKKQKEAKDKPANTLSKIETTIMGFIR